MRTACCSIVTHMNDVPTRRCIERVRDNFPIVWMSSTESVNLAFRSGWSKTGNAVLASDGTKSE